MQSSHLTGHSPFSALSRSRFFHLASHPSMVGGFLARQVSVRTGMLLVLLLASCVFGLPSAWAAVPSYIVTTTDDATVNSPGDCTDQSLPGAVPDASCSLRDALTASGGRLGSGGSITFSATVFATPKTITLVNGSLNVPSDTTITGPTTGSGASLTTLLTVAGQNAFFAPDFNVAQGVVNAAISSLSITASPAGYDEGIENDGALTLIGVSVSSSGGIVNDSHGNLTVFDCDISDNADAGYDLAVGGGILNDGILHITNSKISGNSAASGGGIQNLAGATMSILDSTITGNISRVPMDFAAGAGGVVNLGTMTISNSIIADNKSQDGGPDDRPVEYDCAGAGCPTNNVNGNVIGAGLSSLLPGSAAICAGLLANIPSGLTTDLRGLPRTTIYSTASGNTTCVDSGAIQTHFGLTFSTQPPSTVLKSAPFTAAVQLVESGSPIAAIYPLSLALAAGDNGTLANGIGFSNANGKATFSNLLVSAAGAGDSLVTSLPVTATPPPPSLTAPVSLRAASNPFNVTASTDVQATIGTTKAGLTVIVDGVVYTSPVTLGGWVSGSQHTIATTSPQTLSAEQYFFTSWSDGGAISHTITAGSAPSYTATFPVGISSVVNTTSDDATGISANCASTSPSPCTLRDALAAVTLAGGGAITFDPTLFAVAKPSSAKTITLVGGTLNVSSNTTITGPTNGTPPPISSLVTINGNNQSTVFSIGNAETNIVFTGLQITGGNIGSSSHPGGGGIYNGGILTLSSCIISGNTAGSSGLPGGGIYNGNTLTVSNSIISGNSANNGAGIENHLATLTVTKSLISRNVAAVSGVAIDNSSGVVTVTDSTISGNTGGGFSNSGGTASATLTLSSTTITGNNLTGGAGGGISASAINTLIVTNTIVAGNTAATGGADVDCGGLAGCPVNGTNGNIIGGAALLAPLSNFGGPTLTMPPLPGSPAICAGLIADIPSGLTTDQRSFPRKTTYGSNPACLDSGAVQTKFALAFTTQLPSVFPPNTYSPIAVTLSETGTPFKVSGITIPIGLQAGDPGSLNDGSLVTDSSGIAFDRGLLVTAAGIGDALVATLPLTTSPPPAALTSPISITQTSTTFDVVSPTTQVTIKSAPAVATFSVDGVSYSGSVSFTWIIGSQHTLAVPPVQPLPGTHESFLSWSDGGAISHTITAQQAYVTYTANFAVAYLLSDSGNPSQGGTISPASGTYYPAGTGVNLVALPNAGYTFAGWTGQTSGSIADSRANTTITMNAPETVTGKFATGINTTFTVTTESDDAVGVPSNCVPGGTNCTLRDAVEAAADAGIGSIFFSPTLIGVSLNNTLSLGSNTTITGTPARISTGPDANGDSAFTINSGVTNVVISNFALGGGASYLTIGGGFYNEGNLTLTNVSIEQIVTDFYGAGIYNTQTGTLTLNNCDVSRNRGLEGSFYGIGIFNDGVLHMTGSRVQDNISYDGSGAGILNGDSATMTIVNSIISGNLLYDSGYGGGILNSGKLTISNSTITGNQAPYVGSGSGIYNGGTLSVSNTFLAGNINNNGDPFESGPPVVEDDCDGNNCPVNAVNGNVVGSAPPGPTPTPVFRPAGGTYAGAQTVTILEAIAGATIHYTTDGTTPGVSSPIYTGPITVSSSESIKALALAPQYTTSGQGFGIYTIIPNYAATPVFSVPAGIYNTPQTVTITDATPGATIYYTTNNTTPTTASTRYTVPITISSTGYLQAIAIATNFSPSAVERVGYTIEPLVATPTFSLPSGTYTGTQMVTISDTTPGATIYYTTNGTTPGRSSPIATSTPIAVTSSETIKALAVATGDAVSGQGFAVYTIQP